MNEITLEAEKRTPASKGAVKTLRKSGRVPAVAYGDKEAPVALSVNEKAVLGILSQGGRNALISLKVDGGSHAVLIKEIQRDPLTRSLRHVDFQRVSLKQKIETKVAVHVKGEAPGVKVGGGVLEHLVREVRVRCLPTEIPASIDADISNLQLNGAIRAKDLALPKGVEILMDAESVVIHVVTVHVEEAAATPEAAAAATTAEPEVIKKGKVEEGEEGAAPAAKAGAAPAAAKGAAPAAGAKPEAKKPEGK